MAIAHGTGKAQALGERHRRALVVTEAERDGADVAVVLDHVVPSAGSSASKPG